MKKAIVWIIVLGAAGYAAWRYQETWLPKVQELIGGKEPEPQAAEASIEEVDEVVEALEAEEAPAPSYSEKELRWLGTNLTKPFKMKCPQGEDAKIDPAKEHMKKGRHKFAKLSPEKAERLIYRFAVQANGQMVELGACRFGEEMETKRLKWRLYKTIKPANTGATGDETAFGAQLTGPTKAEVQEQAEAILKKERLTVTPAME